jgi:hypothetical protein
MRLAPLARLMALLAQWERKNAASSVGDLDDVALVMGTNMLRRPVKTLGPLTADFYPPCKPASLGPLGALAPSGSLSTTTWPTSNWRVAHSTWRTWTHGLRSEKNCISCRLGLTNAYLILVCRRQGRIEFDSVPHTQLPYLGRRQQSLRHLPAFGEPPLVCSRS